MEPQPPQPPRRLYAIDLLRLLAALAVVFYHYAYRGYMANHYSPVAFPALAPVAKYGYLGVELFFIISGYVVLRSAQGKTVRQFFRSRATRLYPAFWVACTLTFAAKQLWGAGSGPEGLPAVLHATVPQYLYNLTMLHEFLGVPVMDSVYWSLTMEITFYFLIALLIGSGRLRSVDWFLVAWLAYAALPGLPHIGPLFALLFFPRYAPYFIAGMLFFLMQPPQGRTPLRYGLLLLAYLLALRTGAKVSQELAVVFQDSFSNLVAGGAITAFFGVFFLITREKLNFHRQAWLAAWGGLTYPLYLLHCDIGFLTFHRLGSQFNKYVLLAGLLLLMLAAARGINVWVEKRLSQQLGQQLDKALDYLNRRF
ncbi:acyltransferase [Hymenobacter sp. DH14]|uniref:Acyltransferase n=1 Tax=Hymenobacter cyanobacteriorum TaxID=2926463 RepID=A0A9X2AF72_9BACT|nr:acyltransferase [Hymenobacter cyanobacteriorum]MCI1186158.1 acyltransferase [Hymenobacter cyanobacteriorum]